MLQRAFQNLAALETNLDETNFVAVKLRIKKGKKRNRATWEFSTNANSICVPNHLTHMRAVLLITSPRLIVQK